MEGDSLIMSQAILISLALTITTIKKQKKKKKLWSKPWYIRRCEGRDVAHLLFKELKYEDRAAFKNFSRLSVEAFSKLHSKLKHLIKRQNTVMGECINSETRLLLTLRYLATGETNRSLSYSFRISPQLISEIIPETVQAIYKVLANDYLKTPNTKEGWEQVAKNFEEKWNFPFCLGALDGKHIMFRARKSDGSFYFNYKGFNSIILMALVDADYNFLYVDVGCNGRVHDAGVYSNSNLCEAIQNNLLDFPDNKCLPETDVVVPYVIVADDAYKFTNRIMKPHSNRLIKENKIFNYRLSRARRVVENAFGILANRFQVLQKDIRLDVSKVQDIVLTACVLHNFIKVECGFNKNTVDNENTKTLSITQGIWRENTFVTHLEPASGVRSATQPMDIRNKYTQYFNTVGMVPWQWEAINKYNF